MYSSRYGNDWYCRCRRHREHSESINGTYVLVLIFFPRLNFEFYKGHGAMSITTTTAA